MDSAETTYGFDPALIEGGTQVHFRVLASDGFHTGSADAGPIQVEQAPAIAVEDPIDAGDAVEGDGAPINVIVTNSGTGPLTIQSITSSSPVFKVQAVLPMVVQANGSAVVPVLYAPTAVGLDSGTLRFTSNATNSPTLEVAIQGTGTDGQTPSIGVSKGPVYLGAIAIGQTLDVPVPVRNASLVELDVQWSLAGAGFSVVETPVTFTLDALEDEIIAVQFAPGAEGAFSGELTITSNDPDDPRIVIAFEGEGYAAPAYPEIYEGGVVDAAQGGDLVAPGGIASLYGTGLAGGVALASDTPLPTELGGLSVYANGIKAPLYFVSPGQINFQIPFEIPSGEDLRVSVVAGGRTSYSASVAVADFAPALFMNPATGEAIIQRHSDGSLIDSSNPATGGEILTIYLTGVGSVTETPETGAQTPADPLAWATQMPSVTVGGTETTVYFCGLSPFFIGLAQIDIGLPDPLPEGTSLPLVVRFGEVESEEVDLPVL